MKDGKHKQHGEGKKKWETDESGTENSSKEEIAREREIEGKLKEKEWKRECECEKVKLGFCWECAGRREGVAKRD